MVWKPEVISSLFESKKEEEKDEDFVTKTSNFVDNHLGAFRVKYKLCFIVKWQ